MKSTRCAAALAATVALILVSCGGGGGSQPVTQVEPPPRTQPDPEPPLLGEKPNLPLQRIRDAVQAPIVEVGGTTHIGLDIAPGDDAEWRHDGTVRGIDMHRARGPFIDVQELKRYVLHDHQQGESFSPYVQRFTETPPTIHLRPGTNEELTSVAVRAVQIINAALPSNWQLSFSERTATIDANGVPAIGQILIEFGARETWTDHDPIPASSDTGGSSERWITNGYRIDMGRVWADHTRARDDQILSVVIHEILHVLGREHPMTGLFPDTIMNPYVNGVEGHELHPLDREALNAIYYSPAGLYTVNEFIATDLGYWAHDSLQVLGRFSVPGGTASFGTASSVAGHRAWAFGPTPATTLANNRAISGTARWGGMMAGITTDPLDPQTIGAAADLSVDLADLDGRLDFTQMRYLRDTSIVWGDGDLGYSIEVRGNTFVQTGGDAGIVTGAFFGTSHEGMGGSLERSDLTAAFGAVRQ